MKISLCLPVYKRPEMLVQCLMSILRQKHEDWEVVIKDGFSEGPITDSEIVQACAREIGVERFKYVASPDGGIFPALNQALVMATGDILHFICSDDGLADSEALYWVNQAFTHQEEDEPFWLHGQCANVNFAGKVLDVVGAPTSHAALLMHNRIAQPSAFWNRKAYEIAGHFNEEYRHAADYDYWLTLYDICEPGFISRPLGIFRKWEEQNTQKNLAATEREAKRISCKHRGVEIHAMDTEEYWEFHYRVVEEAVRLHGEEHRAHFLRENDYVEAYQKNWNPHITVMRKFSKEALEKRIQENV